MNQTNCTGITAYVLEYYHYQLLINEIFDPKGLDNVSFIGIQIITTRNRWIDTPTILWSLTIMSSRYFISSKTPRDAWWIKGILRNHEDGRILKNKKQTNCSCWFNRITCTYYVKFVSLSEVRPSTMVNTPPTWWALIIDTGWESELHHLE